MDRYEISELEGMKYYIYLPLNFDKNKKYPLMVFLHGAGERYELSQVRRWGPLQEIDKGMELECVIIAPFCEGLRTWFDYGERLSKLVDLYRHKKYIDIERVSVTGLSMGGYGTWHMGMSHPEWLSAIAPVCGGGYVWDTEMLRYLKVWAFHGDKDECVPMTESTKVVERAKKDHGIDIKITIYKDWGHDIWTPVYSNHEVYEWLLSQTRNEIYKGQ